jgi:hypothetical protein
MRIPLKFDRHWYRTQYLRSAHWLDRRRRYFAAGHLYCERPGCWRRAADVHHRNYWRLGQEADGDLMAVCRPCHDELHGRRRPEPEAANDNEPELPLVGGGRAARNF